MDAICDHHKTYQTSAEADAALARAVEGHKASGRGGKSWKNLSIFPHLDHWHIGRSRQHFVKVERSAAPPDPPPLIPTHNMLGCALRITESTNRFEGEIRKQGTVIGYVTTLKRTGVDSFGLFLDEAGATITNAMAETPVKKSSAGRFVPKDGEDPRYVYKPSKRRQNTR